MMYSASVLARKRLLSRTLFTLHNSLKDLRVNWFSDLRHTRLSHWTAGCITMLISYASALVIVLQAAQAAGAEQADMYSWIWALGIGTGLTCIILSLKHKIPVLTAWSTPGAVLLATSAIGFSLPEVLGACILSGLLLWATGFVRVLTRLLEKIPAPITSAMLAGILLSFCLRAFSVSATDPVLFLIMLSIYLFVRRLAPTYTMLLLLMGGVVMVLIRGDIQSLTIDQWLAVPVWTTPQFSWAALVTISIPLYVVTMTSQNLPASVVIRSFGYAPPMNSATRWTGFSTVLLAPLGAFALNLAAVSAAICLNDEADPNRQTRYLAGVCAGIIYIIAAIFGAAVVSFFIALPVDFLLLLAGFALLATLVMATRSALEDETYREAGMITLLISASPFNLLGIGAPVWGLLAGILIGTVLKKKAR